MPYARRTKKKTYKRKARRTRKRAPVFRPQRIIPVGFPKTTCVKLRYVDSTAVDAGLDAVGYVTFRANSCFDPDFTGVGHQPMGFDQWATFYNHYVVVGSRITANFATRGTATALGFGVRGINLHADTTMATDLPTILEQGLTKKTLQSTHNNAQMVRSVSRNFSAKKFFNVTNVLDNIGRIGASIAANPSEQAYFHVFSGNADPLVDPTSVLIMVTIEYIVVFSEPKELLQS